MPPTLRPVTPHDIDALYAISLATADRGGDASHLYQDPKMVGEIYSAPYATLVPELCFVAEDDEGVAGYVCGALDTPAFERQLESDWWPPLRQRYPEPSGKSKTWTVHQRRCFMIHYPSPTPEAIVADYPAHLHMNLLPRLQGQGVGTALLNTWIDAAKKGGASAAHVNTGPANPKGMAFWRAREFVPVLETPNPGGSKTIWHGRNV